MFDFFASEEGTLSTSPNRCLAVLKGEEIEPLDCWAHGVWPLCKLKGTSMLYLPCLQNDVTICSSRMPHNVNNVMSDLGFGFYYFINFRIFMYKVKCVNHHLITWFYYSL